MLLIRKGKSLTEVRVSLSSFPSYQSFLHTTVSRLYGHSKNYDMDLTLDYNVELFPLQKDQNFALALASSLSRGQSSGTNPDGSAEDERDVWRPDGKGSRGLEDDYDYVMYGKVWILYRYFCLLTKKKFCLLKIYKFDGGVGEIVYVFDYTIECSSV